MNRRWVMIGLWILILSATVLADHWSTDSSVTVNIFDTNFTGERPYLNMDNGVVRFNETRLNESIDARDTNTADTNATNTVVTIDDDTIALNTNSYTGTLGFGNIRSETKFSKIQVARQCVLWG